MVLKFEWEKRYYLLHRKEEVSIVSADDVWTETATNWTGDVRSRIFIQKMLQIYIIVRSLSGVEYFSSGSLKLNKWYISEY